MFLYFGIAPNTYTFVRNEARLALGVNNIQGIFPLLSCQVFVFQTRKALYFDIFHIVATLVFISLRLRGRNPHLYSPGFFHVKRVKRLVCVLFTKDLVV